MENSNLALSLVIWVCILHLCQSQHEQYAGPFQMVLRQIELCPDTGTNQIYPSSTRINRHSRHDSTYKTNVTSEIVVNDDISLALDFAVFGNGGWRPHYLQMEFSQACSSTKQMLPALYKFLADSLHSECPVSPGTYELDFDMEHVTIDKSVPNFPYGRYRLEISGYINDTLIGCVRNYMDAIPRRPKPKKPKH